MSLPQSKAEKTDAQVRRAGGRSGGGGHHHHQHPPKGGPGVGGQGPHNSSNTGGKRTNGPGGQSRGNPNAGSSQSNANVNVQNGGHTQRQQAGQVSASGSATMKQSGVVASKSNGILPKPPISHPSHSKASEKTPPVTNAVASVESTRSMLQQPFAFQFGSFSPVSVNGLQIPARTSSAPPNFDEQRRDQARSGMVTDVAVGKSASVLTGTSQQGEGQGASILELPPEGNKSLSGAKAAPYLVQSQGFPGGATSSGSMFPAGRTSSSQLQPQGAAPGSYGVSPHLQSQGAASGARALNSQLQSQGIAPQPHVPISQRPSQVSTSGLHASNTKMQSQGANPVTHPLGSQLQSQMMTPGLHGQSSQLQSQALTAGTFVPGSQMQSQVVAPGSRPLQVPLQMPQVQQQVYGSQGLAAGALPSQGMLHHGLSFPQPMTHMIRQQVNAHMPSQQFLPGNHQMNAQMPLAINSQLSGSVGTHMPSYVPSPQTNQYSIPQRTSTVKITHPETHEEIKFGPKGVKSDSHSDNGMVPLVVADSSSLGAMPAYGSAHSGSIPISGMHSVNFYPSVSAGGSYGHPPSFQQSHKVTSTVRAHIARPSTVQNLPPLSHSGANVDALKQSSHATESGQTLEGKTTTSMPLSHSSRSSSSSAVVPDTKEEGNLQSTVTVSKSLAANKSDVGVKLTTTTMPATSTVLQNPSSDGIVLSSSTVSAGPGVNNHAGEEQKSESFKPVGVSTKEHTKKIIKSESKHKKQQQQQQASLLRSPSNAQVELKGEVVTETAEVGGSCVEAEKSALSPGKHKKQQQQASLRNSSNARSELKEENTMESCEVSAACTETDKSALSLPSLSTSVTTSVTGLPKTAKLADGGATPELARKALGNIAPSSNLASNPSKVDRISTSKSSSGSISNIIDVSLVGVTGDSVSSSGSICNIIDVSPVGVTGDSVPVDEILPKDSFRGASETIHESEPKEESVITGTLYVASLDHLGEGKTEASGLVNNSTSEEKQQVREDEKDHYVVTSGDLTSSEAIPEADSNNRDVKKLDLESASNCAVVICSNSDQSVKRESEDAKIPMQEACLTKKEMVEISDSLSLPVSSTTVNIKEEQEYCAESVVANKKPQMPDEDTKVYEMNQDGMSSQQAELDNDIIGNEQNLMKDKTEELTEITKAAKYSDETPQLEPKSEAPMMLPVADAAIMQRQSGLPAGDTANSSYASKSGCDIGAGQLEASPVDVKKFDMQDKVRVSISNSNIPEAVAASPQVRPLAVESEVKLDSSSRVRGKELRSSSSAQSNSKNTNIGDVPKVSFKNKKKRKDFLSKADAAAPTGDLYNAYKVPEKQEDVNSVEPNKVVSHTVEEKLPLQEAEKEVPKEVDDWEDAAELSTNMKQVAVPISKSDKSGDRKYSRDFLLTFRGQFKDLPANFEIRQDIRDLLDNQAIASHHGDGESLASVGRVPDGQPAGNSRVEDKWTKPMEMAVGVRDMRMEMAVGGPLGGFRPGQGYNTGFGKNMRGAAAGMSGILPTGAFGQAPFPQGGIMRNNSDVDRWQRASGFQKGLIPPPQAPYPAIHKTENRYELGKFSDEEQLKQRQIKSILNKLTPQNFDKLFLKVKEVNIDSADCLTGVISQIFDKALMEPTFCEMYAKFCVQLAAGLPEFYEDNERVMFRRVLLNKCQEEFERDEREQAEAEKAKDGEIKLSKEEVEEKRAAQRRRMLGNIRFIGELYKESMLTERIMHECIKTLLGEYHHPDEENVEALCKLMTTIGHMIDHSKAKEHIDAYFERIASMASNQALPSRLRFMLKDVIDLRKSGWQQRRKVDGPKKIEEVHRDAAQERHQGMGGRLNRTPSMGHSGRRLSTPPDHGSRGPSMSPFMGGASMGSASHMSGMRGPQGQTGMRGFIAQDARCSDKFMPMPLQHRPSDDGGPFLGPQGGLGRGITGRGQPLPSNRSGVADGPPVTSGSGRRAGVAVMSGYNHGMGADRMSFGTRDEISSRAYSMEKSLFPKSGIPERNAYGNERRELRSQYPSIDKGGRPATPEYQQDTNEEQLRKKTDMAIKEFYSVRDMGEAMLCVCDLKSVWFHPTLVSLWIMDSFDRKDIERDLLGNLLVHLYKTEPFVLTHEHLIKGLEKVLMSLEDSIVDAPKAPEFLGRILGKLVVADILSLQEIAVPLEEGGVEPGSLLEMGHAVIVLGTVLEVVRRERGENALLDLYRSSGLRLEGFMPPGEKPGKLESFLENKSIQCLSPVINRHL